MKTFVINLEKDVVRRRYMERLIVGTPFADAEFVTAVFGKSLTAAEKLEVFDRRRYGYAFSAEATDGEIGCAVSHYNVWRRVADGDDEVTFVLEDDLQFDGDVAAMVEWSACWLASPKPRVVLFSHYFFSYPWNIACDASRQYSTRPRRAFGTYCYGINRAAARLLVSLGRPHYTSDDWDYFQRCGLEMCAPIGHSVGVDYDFPTNISGRSAYVVSKFDAGAQLVAPCYFGCVEEFYSLIAYKLGLMRFFDKS